MPLNRPRLLLLAAAGVLLLLLSVPLVPVLLLLLCVRRLPSSSRMEEVWVKGWPAGKEGGREGGGRQVGEWWCVRVTVRAREDTATVAPLRMDKSGCNRQGLPYANRIG